MGITKRMLNLFGHSRINREIESELAAHLDLRTEHNIEQGMAPGEARRDALVRFGSPTAIASAWLGRTPRLRSRASGGISATACVS